jgi:hypothetical protein
MPRSKWFVLLAFGVSLTALSIACAGSVSLEPSELQQLRLLLRTDPNAAAQFAPLHTLADQAMVDQPAPIQKVVSEGHLASDPRKIQTVASLGDMNKTEALAWTWAVTGDRRYLARAEVFLTAWARVNQPDGDPINESAFRSMCVAYDLTRAAMSQADRQLVDAWLIGKAKKLLGKKQPENNWGGHAVEAVGLIGLTLGNQNAIDWAVDEFKHLMRNEFHANGSTTDFFQRDALHYQLGSVVPLLYFARAEARNGVDLFDYMSWSGAKLRTAVDYVRPFAEGKKVHIEFANSTVQFDRQRANDHELEYTNHLWEPQSAVGMFALAAWFRPEYGKLAAQIAGHPGALYVNWEMVLNAVSRHPDHGAGIPAPGA